MQILEALVILLGETTKPQRTIAQLIEQEGGKKTTAEERAAIVNEAAGILNINISGNVTACDGSPLRQDGWNATVHWLDRNYPGWRGYPVTYPDGRVG